MPAGILLRGKPKEDKKLIEAAMALEALRPCEASEGSLTKDPSKPTIDEERVRVRPHWRLAGPAAREEGR